MKILKVLFLAMAITSCASSRQEDTNSKCRMEENVEVKKTEAQTLRSCLINGGEECQVKEVRARNSETQTLKGCLGSRFI